MSMLVVFHWVASTPLAIYLRDSQWAFASIEVVHLLALALFGGAVILADLRFFGVGLKTQTTAQVVRGISPQIFGSLAVMMVTGALMVVSGPMRYYYNEAFRAKMGLFGAGATLQLLIHYTVSRSRYEKAWWRKTAAGLSLILWLGVALAGRAIGYI